MRLRLSLVALTIPHELNAAISPEYLNSPELYTHDYGSKYLRT